MPRSNRYFLPGFLWHITHRCHKKEFLLKFARDRDRECWLGWLFESKRRYGLCVLNYVVTSEVVPIFRTTPLGVFSTISGRFWQLDGFIVNLIGLCLQGLMLSVLIKNLEYFCNDFLASFIDS